MNTQTKVEIVDLTRELAEELAEHIPTYQRYARPKWITALAADIDEGRWRLGDSAIVVATDDKGRQQLQNGQHRVLARLDAETDPECPVILLTRPADDLDDYLVTDAGKKRAFADYLRMLHETNVNVKAAVVRTIAMTERQGISAYTLITKPDTSNTDLANTYHQLNQDVFNEAIRLYVAGRHLGFPGTVCNHFAGLYYVVKVNAPDLPIDEFADSLLNVEAPAEGPFDAGILLRKRVLRWAVQVHRVPRTVMARTILKCWGMWLAGEKATKIQLPRSNEGLHIIPEWASTVTDPD